MKRKKWLLCCSSFETLRDDNKKILKFLQLTDCLHKKMAFCLLCFRLFFVFFLQSQLYEDPLNHMHPELTPCEKRNENIAFNHIRLEVWKLGEIILRNITGSVHVDRHMTRTSLNRSRVHEDRWWIKMLQYHELLTTTSILLVYQTKINFNCNVLLPTDINCFIKTTFISSCILIKIS